MYDKLVVLRIRSIAFSLLTPFFFIKAGTLVSLHALATGLGLILLLLGVKVAGKFIGVWPLTRAFGMSTRMGT
jgi:Kef-type K+ transport system membrane component KefB